MRFCIWVYSILLRLYPPRFRSRFGRDMRELFSDRVRAEGAFGPRLWARTVVDAVRHAPAAWIDEVTNRESRRDHDGGSRRSWMGAFVQDIRHGSRALLQRPGFTVIAVLTLAIGIGANTAIFSVVDAVVVKPLPFPDADRLYVLWEANPHLSTPYMYLAPPNFADWRGRSRSFEKMGVWREQSFTLSGRGAAEHAFGTLMSHDLFDVLRVAPVMGRTFTEDEDKPGAGKVVVISTSLWRRWFGAGQDVLGRTIEANGVTRQVIGVMPESFTFPPPVAVEGAPAPRQNELWLPLGLDLAAGQRGAHYLLALGRLAPGADETTAARELEGIAAQIAREHPDTQSEWTARIVPFGRQVTGDQRPALAALSIAAGLVLLLACANVASLLLARGVARRREVAIRVALGATRIRVVRQLLTENVLLSAVGAGAGLLLASWLVRTVRTMGGPMLPRLDEVAIDIRALAFAAAACLIAALLFGLAPAVQVSRARTHDWLKERGGSPRSAQLQSALVVIELALSVVLLAGAALLGESFLRLMQTDPGFTVEGTLTAHVSLPAIRYADRPARAAFVERTLDRLRSSPGITAAAAIDALAIADDRQGTGFVIEGEAPSEAVATTTINFSFVSPGYFETMGIPLIAGRTFDNRDRLDGPATIVITQSFARRFFSGRDPIGRRLRVGFNTDTSREIVGIVGDERHIALDREPPPGVYVSYLQIPLPSRVTLIARTAGDPASGIALLRQVVGAIDPQLALFDLRTMEQIVDYSVSRPRFSALLLGIFAATALLLATVGVYGVISQLVGQRTQEFGIRMALGAAPADVARLVLGFGLRLAAAGVSVGVPAALLFSRVLSALLYGVNPSNPLMYAAVALVLGGAATVAAIAPARRATRVDPLLALRAE